MQAAPTLPMTVPTQDDVGWTWMSGASAYRGAVPERCRGGPGGRPMQLPRYGHAWWGHRRRLVQSDTIMAA